MELIEFYCHFFSEFFAYKLKSNQAVKLDFLRKTVPKMNN